MKGVGKMAKLQRRKQEVKYVLQDAWIETEPRGYRVFKLWIDSETGLTSKYDNLAKFVGWSASKVKTYAKKRGLSVVRKTFRVNRTPRAEILAPRKHAIGDLKVIELNFDKHALYYCAKGSDTFKAIVSHECGFLCSVLADKIVTAWNDHTEHNIDDALYTFDYLLETGGAACRGSDIAQIVRLA